MVLKKPHRLTAGHFNALPFVSERSFKGAYTCRLCAINHLVLNKEQAHRGGYTEGLSAVFLTYPGAVDETETDPPPQRLTDSAYPP